ncbi:hypothetical protein SLS61_004087 [Didymella pomorum]
MGGNKFIWEVSVFLGDKGVKSNPNILFKVDTSTHVPSFQNPKGKQKNHVKKKSKLRPKARGPQGARRKAVRIVYEIGVEGYERSMDQEGWSGANYA